MLTNAASLARHTLVRLRPDGAWQPIMSTDRTRLSDWFFHGWPAIVARLQGDEPQGYWRFGVPLPPDEGKRRLALLASHEDILETRQSLLLYEIIETAPSDWHAALQDLLQRARNLELAPQVYGSFSWQALTRLNYVNPESDLDLLWQPLSKDQWYSLAAMLQDWEEIHGRRADGEIALPDGAGVCWRELAGTTSVILVKTRDSVQLRSRAAILTAFSEGEMTK